jgi:RNA polymerase I-specific transcription initiation factor RRN7
MAKRLARVLSLPLTLHHSFSPGLKQIRKRDPEKHKFDHVPPELALISTAIVVLKMVYGLDGRPRLLSDNF